MPEPAVLRQSLPSAPLRRPIDRSKDASGDLQRIDRSAQPAVANRMSVSRILGIKAQGVSHVPSAAASGLVSSQEAAHKTKPA
ncbi:hypothetical protein XCV1779 [Xanthomonas euvesicatoria pv. vesicatoria str. 85-10]|uniref:Uncharacterized protein n=1 Tax=Xanthomonas euvesicatoria pv. vesicatoria (strain 85-10) TaxID=316273 RepID=Q3BUQ3_XANE5|nr:hypothetical protein XCV1779 [Xanthomonas euvesicatoria pv. vesicatoria str. 85-10]